MWRKVRLTMAGRLKSTVNPSEKGGGGAGPGGQILKTPLKLETQGRDRFDRKGSRRGTAQKNWEKGQQRGKGGWERKLWKETNPSGASTPGILGGETIKKVLESTHHSAPNGGKEQRVLVQ